MIKNFLFHRVSPERDQLWDPMSVELFEKCIKYISSNFTVITIEELLNNNISFTKLNYATISFDDGYKDNIEYAVPILAKYNVKASFYVVTDCIEKNIPTWTYILEYLFQKSANQQISINFDFLPSDLNIKDLSDSRNKIEYVKKLKPFLKKISHEKRQLVLNEVIKAFNDIPLPKIMMSWEDLKSLIASGHVIGSHTVTHSMLGTMNNEEELRFELEESGNIINRKLGFFPLTISYPVGSYNNDVIRLSKMAGYKLGLAVKQQPYNPICDNLFEIPRIELYNESWWKTKLTNN
jgi:peptidoglycan/xylan/chitin deacetylase (PgdA/CDA1 family)